MKVTFVIQIFQVRSCHITFNSCNQISTCLYFQGQFKKISNVKLFTNLKSLFVMGPNLWRAKHHIGHIFIHTGLFDISFEFNVLHCLPFGPKMIDIEMALFPHVFEHSSLCKFIILAKFCLIIASATVNAKSTPC